MILALALIMLGATNAMGQKIYQAELDKSMFKAWDGCGADAKEVANPDPIDVTAENPSGVAFNCDYNLFTEVGDWSGIFGSSAAYYLWYADITGTQKMHFKGSAGFKFWVQFNRQAPVEGGDAHGSDMVQQELTIGDDGTCTYEIPSDMTYVHLNCIKTKGSGVRGLLRSIVLEGTVKPVTGILPMISNGDAEGDDLSSFPVSWDGPNNGGTANDLPEVVAGVGVNGSKAFKVVSYPDPTETWHTQFYVKSDEVLPKGTKWALKMSIKAERNTKITTSAQAAPRAWLGGFINEFAVTTDWQEYTWSGEIGVDGFQSIAFDLNNGDERNADDNGWLPGNGTCGFFFDNIEFGVDLGGANPMSEITTAYGGDAIRINLANKTNMKKLVEASKVQMMVDGAPMKTLVYPNECATVTWNGKQCNIISVEGRADGNLYVFLLDMDGEGGDDFTAEDADVKVSFKNPDDAAFHLTFEEGKWAGESVPDFDRMNCDYVYELSEGANGIYSYMWGAPTIEKVEPEDGSFNLPADMKEFTVTFSQKVDVTTVVAKLGSEALTVSPAEGEAKIITLTRTGAGDLAGVNKLVISHAVGEKGYDLDEPITLKYSFGPTELSGDDQPEVIYQSDFTNEATPEPGAGWQVNADAGGLQPANSGSGCRLMHNQGAFAEDLLYVAQRATPASQGGVALYGLVDDYKLALQAGKNYHLTLGACQHDRTDVALTVQVLPEAAVSTEDGTILDDTQILVSDRKEITPAKNSKEAIRFDLAIPVKEDGNYVLRFVPSKSDGSLGGYDGCVVFGDVKVEYIPDIMGLVEMNALTAALDAAKTTRANNEDERFNGEAYTALDNKIKEYDGKVMTAPSAYAAAQAELQAATEAMSAHRKLCDEYDVLPEQLFTIYAQNKDSKFNVTELFAQLKPMVDKYCTVESQVTVDDEGNEVTADVVTAIKVIKDDTELAAAKDELSALINIASKMFTTGKSQNVYGNVTTGYAALHERLRRGVELLKSLGVPETADEIVLANAELGDNDEIAAAIIRRAQYEILSDLASGNSKLFAGTVDEVTEETTVPSYDLSVFAKNPNIYGPAYSTVAPGWENVTGNTFAWSSWDGAANHSDKTPYPEDCNIHSGWHPNPYGITQQTIENLPVGVYTIKFQGSDNNSPISEGTTAFVKLSTTPEVGEGEEIDPTIHYAGVPVGSVSGDVEGIEVLDGKLTVGFHFGTGSQAFLNDVEIWMTSPLAGYDYTADYNAVLAGIDVTVAKPATTRRIELFDLNGRRLSVARKGITIVKKHMSDGTVKTEKVVVK